MPFVERATEYVRLWHNFVIIEAHKVCYQKAVLIGWQDGVPSCHELFFLVFAIELFQKNPVGFIVYECAHFMPACSLPCRHRGAKIFWLSQHTVICSVETGVRRAKLPLLAS